MVLAGAVLVLGVDAVFLGRVNGAPAIYPMILLGLPVWELLPRGLVARVGALVLGLVAVVTCWLALASVPAGFLPAPIRGAWGSELSFAGGCLVVGVAAIVCSRWSRAGSAPPSDT